MHKLLYILAMIVMPMMVVSCVHPKIKYRKAKILDPMMDPAKTNGFYSSFKGEPAQWHERSASSAGGGLGGSCPTCGS